MLAYHISIPLHVVFRSSALAANMLLGMLFLRKRYSKWQISAIGLVSAGLLVATLASSFHKAATAAEADAGAGVGGDGLVAEEDGEEAVDAGSASVIYTEWLIGIGMLVFGLVGGAALGVYNDNLYSKYERNARETVFYTVSRRVCCRLEGGVCSAS